MFHLERQIKIEHTKLSSRLDGGIVADFPLQGQAAR